MYVNKSVQDRAWRNATVDYAATMIEKWREQDREAKAANWWKADGARRQKPVIETATNDLDLAITT